MQRQCSSNLCKIMHKRLQTHVKAPLGYPVHGRRIAGRIVEDMDAVDGMAAAVVATAGYRHEGLAGTR
jgi:hypothetical protein